MRIQLLALSLLLTGGDCDTFTSAASETKPLPRMRLNLGVVDPNGKLPDGFNQKTLKIKMTFPGQAVLDKTKQVLWVMRETDSRGCAALWDTEPTTVREGASLFPVRTANARVVSPITDGEYFGLIYALEDEYAQVCETDEWCDFSFTESQPHCSGAPAGLKICTGTKSSTVAALAAGCAKGTLVDAMNNEIEIKLELP